MDFKDAVIQSMKSYWGLSGKADSYESLQSNKDRKYNKKYFDDLKESELGKDKDEV